MLGPDADKRAGELYLQNICDRLWYAAHESLRVIFVMLTWWAVCMAKAAATLSCRQSKYCNTLCQFYRTVACQVCRIPEV